MAKTENIKMCYGHNSEILECVGTRKISEFYISWSKFNDGYVPYCKQCCEKMFNYYLQEYNDEKIALVYSLSKIDTPFIEEVYINALNKTNKQGNIVPLSVSSYINELHRCQSNKEIYTDFSTTNCNVFELDIKGKTLEEKKEELARLEKNWGKQDDLLDYEFLEDTFYRYTQGVEFVNPQQEDLYRDLCRDRLLLRKINDNRYGGEESIDKVQSRVSKTMATLKVDQFESNKPKTLSEQTMFTKIAQIEQTKPADLYKEPRKYRDFNQLRKYYNDLVLRPLLNTLAGHKDFDIAIDNIETYNMDEQIEG